MRTFRMWLFALCVSSLSVIASAQGQEMRVKTGSETTYVAGSSEAVEVKRWLIEQTLAGDSTLALGDFDHIGAVTVCVMRSGATKNTLTPVPPIPLPASGTPGSTIGISSCSGGISQEWVYMWVTPNNGFGSWVLQSYNFMRVKTCASGV